MNENEYTRFVRLYTKVERDLRQFIRSLLPSWHDADEVLQLAALVLWKKFDQFESKGEDEEVDFIRWACVVSRFEALAYRKKLARDKLVFREEVFELMALEAIEEVDDRQSERKALEHCLKQLSSAQNEFIRLAYTPGVKVKELALKAGVKPEAFYMRLNRLRKKLQSCVQRSVQSQQGV